MGGVFSIEGCAFLKFSLKISKKHISQKRIFPASLDEGTYEAASGEIKAKGPDLRLGLLLLFHQATSGLNFFYIFFYKKLILSKISFTLCRCRLCIKAFYFENFLFNMIKNNLILLTTLFCLSNLSLSAQIYVRYFEDCMLEMEYQTKGKGTSTQKVFQVTLDDKRSLILESGRIEKKFEEPYGTENCQHKDLRAETAKLINNGTTRVYVVKAAEDGKYELYQIAKASVLYYDPGRYFHYVSPEMDFGYQYDILDKKTDISNNPKLSNIYYEGASSTDCYEFIKLRKETEVKKYKNTSIRKEYFSFIPSIGILQAEFPLPVPLTRKGVTTLAKINGSSLDEFCEENDNNLVIDDPQGTNPDRGTRDYENRSGVGVDRGRNGNSSRSNSGSSTGPRRKMRKDDLIFMDGISNLWIDRSTFAPANLRLDGIVYIDGRQFSPTDLPPITFPGVLPTLGYTDPSKCKVYWDAQYDQYINLFTGAVMRGTCDGIVYNNGFRVGRVKEGTPDSYECFIVVNDEGYYINPATGIPFTGKCNGYAYRNGIIIGRETDYPDLENNTGSSPNNPNTSNPGGCDKKSVPGLHVVQPGETLNQIARFYNLSVAQLKEWNNLASDFIRPCKELTTSPLNYFDSSGKSNINRGPSDYDNYDVRNAAGDFYVVQPGDNLAGIAQRYGFTEEKLREINQMKNWETVKVGQHLKIRDRADGFGTREYGNIRSVKDYSETPLNDLLFPEKKSISQPDEENIPNPMENNTITQHVVKKGENLYRISQEYGLTVNELKQLNGLTSNTIFPNQTLKIR